MPLRLRHPLTPKNPTGNSIPVTSSFTTLFHNRHAKCRKYTESRLRSTTDHPPYVASNSGKRQSMHLKQRNPLTPKNPTRIIIFRHCKRHNTFPITATLNTGNIQKVGFVRRPISHRISRQPPVRATDASVTPAPSDAEEHELK
jgi:hypothetical protein